MIYPTHIYNSIIPKVALNEHNHYWFSKAATISKSSAKNITFCCLAEKGPYGHPFPTFDLKGNVPFCLESSTKNKNVNIVFIFILKLTSVALNNVLQVCGFSLCWFHATIQCLWL